MLVAATVRKYVYCPDAGVRRVSGGCVSCHGDRVVHRMGLVRLPKLTFQDDAIQEAYDSRLVAGVVDEVVVPTR